MMNSESENGSAEAMIELEDTLTRVFYQPIRDELDELEEKVKSIESSVDQKLKNHEKDINRLLAQKADEIQEHSQDVVQRHEQISSIVEQIEGHLSTMNQDIGDLGERTARIQSGQQAAHEEQIQALDNQEEALDERGKQLSRLLDRIDAIQKRLDKRFTSTNDRQEKLADRQDDIRRHLDQIENTGLEQISDVTNELEEKLQRLEATVEVVVQRQRYLTVAAIVGAVLISLLQGVEMWMAVG